MMDRRRAIAELSQRIRQLEAETNSLLRQLGEYLSYQDGGDFASTPLRDTLHRIVELRDKLPETRQQVKRILQCVSRSEELEKSIRAARAQFAELQKERDRICEEIGRAAFEAFRSARPEEPEYQSIFGSLLKQEREIAGLESEMQKAQGASRSGNFFRIFRESGRSLYVKGLLSLKKKNMGRDYREAGQKFCESALVDGVEDPDLKLALGPYRSNHQEAERLGSEVRNLRSRQETLWAELKELGADRAHQRRVREIEHQIERIEEELEAALGSLGRMYRAKPLKAFADDPEIKRVLRDISRGERTAEQYRKQISRIEAAIQIDSLDKQRGTMEERVERLEREIKSRQEEIRSVKDRIADIRERVGKLAEIRGPEQGLMRFSTRGGEAEAQEGGDGQGGDKQ